MKLSPPIYKAKRLNETFSINVTMNDLKAYWKTVAVQFRVTYNSKLLKVVNVTEGPFMKQTGKNYFVSFNDTADHVCEQT